MRQLLLLSSTTGYQARAFRQAAAKIGVPLLLASNRCHQLEDPWRDRAIAIRFEEPEESAATIAEFARENPIYGVVAIGDAPTISAAYTSKLLGLRYHNPEAVEISRNKFLSRQRYALAGLAGPGFIRIPKNSDPAQRAGEIDFPCVLKPLVLSASRGVIRANDSAEFVRAFQRIRTLLESADVQKMRDPGAKWIQVEDFIAGHEVAVEGLLTQGKLRVLAIFDKPDPLDGPFFEETIYVTPSRLPVAIQGAVEEMVARAAAAIGLTHGPVHAELRISNGQPIMLEMAARPIGGLCARALRFGDGISLEELILRHALEEPVENLRREESASGVMMIPIPQAGIYECVSGIEAAQRVAGIALVEITAKLRQKLVPLPEGASYLGFIFARGPSPDFVEQALRAAHAKLRFEISPELKVMK